MIATAADPLSPHESTSKNAAFPGTSMASTNAIKRELSKRKAADRKTDDKPSGSESGDDDEYDEYDEEERHSAEFQQLTLDSLDGEGLDENAPSTTPAQGEDGATAAEAAAPVKRVLRRRRKRMSEDERRLRHREVQRQFMKRKRARLGEMRKVLRGLEAHHRLAKASSERAMLEKENAELVERLAAPGSGWEWGNNAPPDTQEEKCEAAPEPHVVYLVPEHGHLAFHHHAPHHATPLDPHFESHSNAMQLHWHYPPLYHYAPHPSVLPHSPHHHQTATPAGPHAVAHRPPAVPGVTLPWDDILDAVTGESVDISF